MWYASNICSFGIKVALNLIEKKYWITPDKRPSVHMSLLINKLKNEPKKSDF